MIILSREIQQFINANLNSDLHSLLLKKSPFPNATIKEIVQQIKGKKVAARKFPFLMRDGILFPPQLNLEQASSEATGEYKSALVSGAKMIDLTAGFGIDAWFLSKKFDGVTLVEQNPELLKTVENNWKILQKEASFINQNLEDFIQQNSEKYDLVYLDPARRDEQKNKVFLLEDLSPNLLEIQEKLFAVSAKILVKLSPLIDLTYLLSVLEHISEIHIVAVRNDVKEVLILLDSQNHSSDISVVCTNLETSEPDFIFCWNEKERPVSSFSDPLRYIYLPNNAVLKAGAFNLISARFDISKLHPNTQIYTSDVMVEAFPGRILEVEEIEAKEIRKGEQYNIISKNHPLKPEEIKKKYRLKHGGSNYLIFTQSQKGKIILKSK